MIPSFIFGGTGNTETPTYETLKRKREIADLLAQQAMETRPMGMGEGFASLAQALLARSMDGRLGEQEAAAGASADQSLQGIISALSGGGAMTPELMEQAGALSENPYLGSGGDAILRGLMRRTVQLPEQAGTSFVPPQFSGNVTVSAQNMPTMGADAGQFGWTDPGEVPPSEDVFSRAQAAKQAFDAAPTDANGAALDDAVNGAIDGYGGAGDPRLKEMLGWVEGSLRPQSGAGGPVQRGPAAGLQVAQADTGTATDARDPVKLTEGQSKDLGFWNRMDGVSADLDRFEGTLTDAGQRAKGAVPFVGNALVSEDYQRARRAAEEWVAGILRKDTGAAVTAEEMKRYDQIYIPQAWDDPKTVEDKRSARKRAMEGLKKGLGIAEVLADELAASRQSQAAPAASGGDDWRTQDPSTWTDEQLQEFLK